MADIPEKFLDGASRRTSATMTAPNVRAWFVREVLPLETVLMQYLRRNWSNTDEIADLRQDVYMRVFEAAKREIPQAAKSFVFTTARNLLIDRVRREQVVPIEAMTGREGLTIASGGREAERTGRGRDALRSLQAG